MDNHPASRHGGRIGHRTATRSLALPSSAAAKAAAAAKALHRRAQERAEENQHSLQLQLEDDLGCCSCSQIYPDFRSSVFRRSSSSVERCIRSNSILTEMTSRSSLRIQSKPNPTEKHDSRKSLVGQSSSVPIDMSKSVPSGIDHYPHGILPNQAPSRQDGHLRSPVNEPDERHSPSAAVVDNGDGRDTNNPYANAKKEKHVIIAPETPHPPIPCSIVEEDSANLSHSCKRTHSPPANLYQHSLASVPSTDTCTLLYSDRVETCEKNHVCMNSVLTGSATMNSPVSLCAKSTALMLENKSFILQEVGGSALLSRKGSFARSTRRIIGSHTPIHVPRASTCQIEEDPLPYRSMENVVKSNPESVFRSLKMNAPVHREKPCNIDEEVGLSCESNAHKILLSLSKSFDHAEKVTRSLHGVTMAHSEEAKGRKSPDEPPRIQHWHKQSVDALESQLSLANRSSPKECSNIELTSSFTLFNESFDMNVEGLLGPNASFGLGPMRSLSFGLGLSSSVDMGERPCAQLPRNNGFLRGCGKNVKLPKKNCLDTPQFVQVKQTSSPVDSDVVSSNSSGVTKNNCCIGFSSGDGVNFTRELSYYVETNGVRHPSFCSRVEKSSHLTNEVKLSQNKVEASNQLAKQDLPNTLEMKKCLFAVMRRHSYLFDMFSFLLPTAKQMLSAAHEENCSQKQFDQLTEREKEVARRRINSALCAFGGVVIPQVTYDVWWVKKKSCGASKCRKPITDRFFEDENRLSWDIEENPPIDMSDSEDESHDMDTHFKTHLSDDTSRLKCSYSHSSDDLNDFPTKTPLQRNIGVMVYPAVNAFTAIEPGTITPALSEMNNFVDNKSLIEASPPKANINNCGGLNNQIPVISPDCLRVPSQTHSSRKMLHQSVNYAGGSWITHHKPRRVSPGHWSECPSKDLLFVEMQELQPEQYRTIASRKRKHSNATYLYPPLPLPYGQRKRISNAMFAMSKSIPGLTDECASVLGEARQKDAWDFAVAQLMTQVIVVTHCSVNDNRLDGLSQYLLTLGIAC